MIGVWVIATDSKLIHMIESTVLVAIRTKVPVVGGTTVVIVIIIIIAAGDAVTSTGRSYSGSYTIFWCNFPAGNYNIQSTEMNKIDQDLCILHVMKSRFNSEILLNKNFTLL